MTVRRPSLSQGNAISVDRSERAIKLRYIFLPLLALAGATVGSYSILNWLLVARNDLLPLDEDVVAYWLPLAVSWILVIVLIQPRLSVLKPDKKGNLSVFYHFAAVAMVAVPTMVAQGYVRTATGDITHSKLASDISSGPDTKYYSIDQICIASGKALIDPVVRTSSKRNETLDFDEYVVVPICAQGATEPGLRSVWIGLKFHKSLSNSLGQTEKKAEYATFLRRSESALREENPKSFLYLERLGRNSDRKGFAAALRRAGVDVQSPSSIVLIPHTEPFEERTGDRLGWTFGSFAIGTIGWLALVLLRPLDHAKLQHRFGTSPAAARANAQGALSFLVPRRRTYGLPILIDANIVVFVAMVLAGLGFASFDTEDLLRWGANYRPALHGLGVFRLITSEFVHAGLMHLLNNMYGLLFAGIFLLPVTGNAGLILCYLLAGLGGSIASAAVHPAIVSVGASGAIFGLFGTLLILVLLRDGRVAQVRQFVLTNAAVFVGINLFIGAVSHGIDNAAHVGGLATGIVLGLAIVFTKPAEAAAKSRAAE